MLGLVVRTHVEETRQQFVIISHSQKKTVEKYRFLPFNRYVV